MRNHSSLRKQTESIPWKWVGVIIIIFIILTFLRGIGSGKDDDMGKGILVGGSGTFVATNKNNEKRDVGAGEKFYETDELFSVISGMAELNDGGSKIWLDKNSDFSHTENGSGYLLSQGRMWVEASNDIFFSLKHIDIKLSEGDIALFEQQRIYSIVYVIRGEATVLGGSREAALKGGKRIMVSQSNLINPGVTLESLIGDIDESIQQNAFFLARNGKDLLEKQKSNESKEGSGTINSISGSGNTQSNSSLNKLVTISSPIDGSFITGGVLIVEGKSLSAQVKKIIIQDQPIQLIESPGSFRSSPISINTSTVDLVYKAYDAGNNLLERGVITVYSSDKQSGSEKLVPKTFPTNDKDFRVISPNENPYKTNLSAITVSGTVPKGQVEYITVNNFRLKKFIAKSTTWYYYANTEYQTMKEGFNLYEIRFYGPNDALLSTQLFTIIKEGGVTLSGE
ncbi:MAG: hypothetical protein HHAS10_06790 [Candidatus Altimarinota bacterium]